MIGKRFEVCINNQKRITGTIVRVETAHILFEIDGEENPWGGPARQWFDRAFFLPLQITATAL